MDVKAILCDSATVRDGLLHLLGGGITRLWRPTFPAQFSGALALIIHAHPTEVGMEHKLQILIRAADGETVLEAGGGFTVNRGDDSEPGEITALPLVVGFNAPPLTIPREGSYSIDVLVDQQHQDSLSFLAKVKT